jgi:hypothetical protein
MALFWPSDPIRKEKSDQDVITRSTGRRISRSLALLYVKTVAEKKILKAVKIYLGRAEIFTVLKQHNEQCAVQFSSNSI